jgi:tetratricopeptide (TPR) repeat protein
MRFVTFIPFVAIMWSACNNTERDKFKDSADERSSGKMGSLIKRANSYYYQDDFANSVKYFDSIIKLDSSNGEYYYKRAFSYTKLIAREDAIKDFKKAILFQYKVAPSCFNIGVNYSYDDDSLALYYFKKSSETDQNFPDVYPEISDCKKRLAEKRGLQLEKLKAKQ